LKSTRASRRLTRRNVDRPPQGGSWISCFRGPLPVRVEAVDHNFVLGAVANLSATSEADSFFAPRTVTSSIGDRPGGVFTRAQGDKTKTVRLRSDLCIRGAEVNRESRVDHAGAPDVPSFPSDAEGHHP